MRSTLITLRNFALPHQTASWMRNAGSSFLFGCALLLGCGAPSESDPYANASLNLLPLAGATLDACIADSQGGDTSCKDVGTWKSYAATACSDKGLQLNNIDYADSCGAGLYRFTKYLCCPVAPPTPTPPTCTTNVQGEPTSCKDAVTWKTYAAEDCAGKGLYLTDYGTYDSCGTDVFRHVKYTCCK